MEQLVRDLRFSFRQMVRRPRTSVLVVICATLAIGLNASIFTLVNATILRPAVEDGDSLVRLYSTHPGFEFASLSYPNFADLEEAQEAFESMAAYSVLPANVAVDGPAERLPAVVVTGEYFSTLGVDAALGRVLGPQDSETRMGHPVAVISDRLWRTRFGADEAILGRDLTINSQPFTIVGVTPPEWKGTFPGLTLDLWIPIQMQPLLTPADTTLLDSRSSGWLMTLARLRPGVGVEEAQGRIDVSTAALRDAFPERNENWGVGVHPGSAPFPPAVGEMLEMASLAMMVLVGCVLLIACANVAGLLLARAEERQREIGIRLAIGASREQLVRQLLVESVTLASVGGIFGTLLALGASRIFPALMPTFGSFPVVVDVNPDLRVYAFTLGLTVLTGLLFGLIPALQATRPRLVAMFAGGGGAAQDGGRKRFGLRQGLVGLQVAMSMVLLVTAGLFLGSLDNERHVSLGFDSTGLMLAAMDPSLHGYDAEKGLRFFDRAREEVLALPGVRSAAWGETVPLPMVGNQQRGIEVEGYEAAEGERMNPEYNIVSEGYFSTLGITLEGGRGFHRDDDAEGAPVVVVNRALAERYWPDGNALGGRLYTAGEWRQVVGIAANGKYLSRRESPQPHFYLPLRQLWEPTQQLHVRTEIAGVDGGSTALLGSLRRAIAQVDPEVAVYDVRTLDQHLEASLLLPKLGARFVGIFGALALVLATVGLFGLLSHAVVARRREIGIRMSLGAATREIFLRVLREGFGLVGLGLVVGLLAALVAGKLLAGLLYGVSGAGPALLAAVAGILLTTALLAMAFPALRATRVDPIIALREE